MPTEIKVWQLENDKLIPIESSMAEAGRREVDDLERWIKSEPSILAEDVVIIGEQVQTKSGPADFVGIDKSGNVVVIELKRDSLPREALAQAVDYASDIASWDLERLGEVCLKHTGQPLEDYLNDSFPDMDLEDMSLNQSQRLLLVGTSVEESLQRMVEWLSDGYGVLINAVVFKYVKTRNGDELLARTVIIPEEIERERSQKRKLIIATSDKPGNHPEEDLRKMLREYLSEKRTTPKRIREILLPLCLDHEPVGRDEIIEQLCAREEAQDEGQAGTITSTISRELAIEKRDYLRQVIRYDRYESMEYDSHGSARDNFRIPEEYKPLVRELLNELDTTENVSQPG
ncbi:MAG: hypothetical protein KAW89_08625 [Armatimonadetes bacterium]|nr:hypothetical protein [Armatimonadota bacterium]